MQASIGLKHVLFFGVGHGRCEIEELLVLLFGLEDLDLLGCFLVGLHVHRTAVLKIVELNCAVHRQICSIIKEYKSASSISTIIKATQHNMATDSRNHNFGLGQNYMQGNLKNFVSRFIQERPAQNFPHLYIVDKATGPFRMIQEAIDAAEPNSIIKISEGFYEENLVISKPLRLQPKNADGDRIGVVLLASGGVAVHIKLEEFDHECEITGIKFSHSGNSDNNLKKELMQHEHILNIFQQHESVEQLQSEFVNRMSFNKMDNIILLLERGRAKVNNCILSLNYLVKSCNSTIPAVWVEKDGHLLLANTEVKGNENKQTIGIVCKLGTLSVQNSMISNHRDGGILIWGIKDSNSKIIKSLIQGNSVGIHLVGEQFKLKIINNRIQKNKTGVKVGLACEPDISSNLIFQNHHGIEVNSAFPIISLNKIEKSKFNGIVCRSYKKFICKAIIKKNIGIAGNLKNGILIEGDNNRTQILNNHMIGFNHQSGIRVEKEAFPSINGNKIYKNYKEGILVVENSNAIIEKNDISHNIECNVAVGGANSHHTVLLENTVSNSPNIGINVIYSSQLRIIRNDVFQNQEGVVLTSSRPNIENNYIYENRNNGVACQHKSNPKIVENFITRNGAVGILLRHQSAFKESVIHSNIVVGNEIDLAMQEYNKEFIDSFTESNTIQGEIYYPQGISCSIM